VRSELIEFFRFNELDTGMLRRGDRYLLARGHDPVREVPITIGHVEFIRRLGLLRYAEQTDEAQRQRALDELSDAVTAVLGVCQQPDDALQVDLVTNAAELSALPFELAVDAERRPIFAVSNPPLVLTRRVRRGSQGERPAWWSKPRVLFAVASHPAAGDPVPFEAHRDALRGALKPWSEPLELPGLPQAVPDDRNVLVPLLKASPRAIRQAGEEAARAGRPYTHLHILAHGCAIGDGMERRFGIAMHDDDDPDRMTAVSPERLCQELQPIAGHLVVVTLAVCDGGNQANSIAGGGSVAHELHSSGIPVVVASQFPLTFDGSTVFTSTFYRSLLAGQDVRDALHRTRSVLYQQHAQIGHDWASLVAYVQLPEDYNDRLHEVRLQAELAALRTAQAWSDHLTQHEVRDSAAFEDVASQLQDRIANLRNFLDSHTERIADSARDENLGLLGSAEKRLAELSFQRAKLGPGDVGWMSRTEQALRRAHAWYDKSFAGNLSHHWTGVQSLSLEAVLTGRISRVGRWYAAKEAAEAGNEGAEELWAYGSLAELYLLAPLAGQGDHLDDAGCQLVELIDRVGQHSGGDSFPIESTARQLERYVHWWTSENGYFAGSHDLVDEARQLLQVISP
jgi:hypothetical protein